MNKNISPTNLRTASKFPHGSTFHFLDAVYLVYGAEACEEFKGHIQKYGHNGDMDTWQVDMMILECGDGYDGFEFFAAGYFGGTVRELKYAQ